MKLSRRQLRKLILKEAYMAGRYFRSEADQQHIDSIEYGLANELENMCDGYGFTCESNGGLIVLTRHDGVVFKVTASNGTIEIESDGMSAEVEYDASATTKGGSYYAETLAAEVLEMIERPD